MGNSILNIAVHQIQEAADAANSAYERGGLVALLILTIIAITTAFMFQWIVPGKLYNAVVDENKKMTSVLEGLVTGLKDVAAESKEWRLQLGPGRRTGSGR